MKIYYETSNELYHHGVKGMKWGVRRYRNPDGSLTPAGKKRQAKKEARVLKKVEKKYTSAGRWEGRAQYRKDYAKKINNDFQTVAKKLEDRSSKYESEGKNVRAVAARVSAASFKAQGKQLSKQHEDIAKEYLETADAYKQSALKVASKKNVVLGMQAVNQVLNKGKEQGYAWEKSDVRYEEESELRETLGEENYELYRKLFPREDD